MSWVITGQSLSSLLGVPLVTLLGALGGWRGAIAAHGAIVILTAVAVRLALPPDPLHHPHAAQAKTPFAVLRKPKLIALLAAGTTERLCFAALAIYLPTYLQEAYGVSLGGLALLLALVRRQSGRQPRRRAHCGPHTLPRSRVRGRLGVDSRARAADVDVATGVWSRSRWASPTLW